MKLNSYKLFHKYVNITSDVLPIYKIPLTVTYLENVFFIFVVQYYHEQEIVEKIFNLVIALTSYIE